MTEYQPVGDKSRQVLALPRAAINIYEGAVRSSKTVTSLVDWLRFTRTGPDGDLAIVGRTERTAARNIIEPLVDMLGPKRCAYNRGTGIVNILGRRHYVIGANNEAATSKIQGMTLAGIYADEVATAPESFFNMATTRMSIPGACMIGTCNPEGREHWLKTKWLDKARQWVGLDGTVHSDPGGIELNRYTYSIDDNPYLDPGFVQRLKTSYSGVWYERFILSRWTNAEGAIFDMWDPALHAGEPDDDVMIVRRVVGMDYGTTNASAAVLLGLGNDGRLYVLDEWRHDSKAGEGRWTDVQLSRGLRDWLDRHATGPRIEWVMVDPSAASFHQQLFADDVTIAAKADNAVGVGIALVASLLTTRRLQIVKAPGLVKEMPEYAWDPKATAKGEDKPIKDRDHSIDALRYACMAARDLWNVNPGGGELRAAA